MGGGIAPGGGRIAPHDGNFFEIGTKLRVGKCSVEGLRKNKILPKFK